MPFLRYEEEIYNHVSVVGNIDCNSPQHNPSNIENLKPGTHTYQCPECGHIQYIVIK